MKTIESMEIYFELVPDKRRKSHITYKLSEILFVLVCGMLCGLSGYEEIADMAEMRWDFFRKHIKNERPPCAAMLCNVLRHINAERLELCLHGIFRNIFGITPPSKERQINIDGKTICGENSIHIVTAMLADEYLSIGQVVVGEKTNEIPAVRELLDLLDIEDDIISADAMHCQTDTVRKIIEKKGDYVLQVKKNQRNLYEDIEGLFGLAKITNIHETIDRNHGRIEKRICRLLPDEMADPGYFCDWAELKRIFSVERITEKNGKVSQETSYYISSKATTAENLLSYTRKHWQIESFHWILDKVMGEDGSFTRDKNAQDCMNRMRKFAVAVMKKYIEQAQPKKKSISGNMRLCLLSANYLEKVIDFFLRVFLLHLCYVD